MHGKGIVLDFEGSLKDGFKQVGYIIINNFEIVYVNELTEVSSKRADTLLEFLSEPYDFFVAHNHKTEKNLIKKEMPYSNLKKSGEWGPWLDTEILYKKLYPQLKNYKLNSLVQEFLHLENIKETLAKYAPHSKPDFHHPLFDAMCSFYLAKRLVEVINLKAFIV
jgi:DNA polymerase III epsilon subunit-like protein